MEGALKRKLVTGGETLNVDSGRLYVVSVFCVIVIAARDDSKLFEYRI